MFVSVFCVLKFLKDEEDQLEQDEAVSEKQRFMLSVITASPPPEEDGGNKIRVIRFVWMRYPSQ